ncbi:MAG TPA: DoxX family protein [Bdellovibrionota bacterium]|jgi:putative oxidoreductase
MLKLKFLGKFREMGMLVLRVGLGAAFVVHGSGKMFHPEMWPQLGGALAPWGITFAPSFWGFMAAFAEFGGGILFILGFLFRPAAVLMAFTMAVALSVHLGKGDGFNVYSHALEVGAVFLGLIFVGPGKLSLDGE